MRGIGRLCERRRGSRRGVREGAVHWGCYYATSLDIEVDLQRCRFGSWKSDFALQAVVENQDKTAIFFIPKKV